MSLATRCTSCGTVFRVVQDQLKVSDGWVRCGRCDAVFNAAEGLFDIELEAPPPWSPTQPPAEAPTTALEPMVIESGGAPGGFARRHDLVTSSLDHGEPFGERHAALGVVEPEPPATGDVSDDLIAVPRRPDDDPEAPAPSFAGLGPRDAGTVEPDAEPHEVPSGFGWRPDAEWPPRRRRTTVLLAGASLLLVGLLAVQLVAQFAEIAAARWPGARPALATWCGMAGCSIAAPRRIDQIVVDSSALAPVIGADALKLGIALRNRANHAVALPSIDLSLTDSAGRLIARRALHPADFRVTAASLPAGGELPLQAIVTAGTAPVTGYTVEIFYP